MTKEKTDAIVVKCVEFSESSFVVALFTRNFGLIRGLAKGARRPKNPFENSLDLLASIKLSFLRKNSDALDLLTEAKLARRFKPTARNLPGLDAGYYLAELLDYGMQEYAPFPDLWTLADATLDAFANRDAAPLRLAAFEAFMLEALGEFPAIRFCAECGRELPLDAIVKLDRRIWFEFASGGVLCSPCLARARRPDLFPTTAGALKALERAQNAAAELARSAQTYERDAARVDAIDATGKLFATEIDALRQAARNDRDAREEDALAPFAQTPKDARDDLRKLLDYCVSRLLHRRPRAADALARALRDLETPQRA